MRDQLIYKNACHFLQRALLLTLFFAAWVVQSDLNAAKPLNEKQMQEFKRRAHRHSSHQSSSNKAEVVDSQRVKEQCVKRQKVIESKIRKIETDELFIDGEPLSPSSLKKDSFPISESITIVGDNVPLPSACDNCDQTCPAPTPGTPSGGLFSLANSFTGKVVFCGVKGLQLDLRGFVLDGDSDVTLEFINCEQVWVHGGAVNNSTGTAIRVSCCSNVCLSRINTTNSESGLLIENSYDVQAKNLYMDNIASEAISFNCSNYLRLNNIDINDITESNSESLIVGRDSGMIFMSNMAMYGINVEDTDGTKSVIKLDACLDVKISHISILSTQYIAAPDMDLNVYLVHITNSGSLILGSFIIDGDFIEVSGDSKGVLNCLRIENGNNTFMAHHLMTDNHVTGDSSSTSLVFEGIHLSEVDTLTLNGSKICTNFVEADCPDMQVRSFYGEKSGNWFLSGNICNQNYTKDFQTGDASVYGFEIFDVDSSVLIQHCSANNHGENVNSMFPISEGGGFKIHNLESDSTVIIIDSCAANQNESANTSGFLSTYSNTQIYSSEANFNKSEGACVGFLLDGSLLGQANATIVQCTANNNSSEMLSAYGAYVTNSVNPNIVSCTFNENSYGIYLDDVAGASVEKNHLKGNAQHGLYIEGGSQQSLIRNSAVANGQAGFYIENSPSSIIEENLSQGNNDGFVDNTPKVPGNSYFANNAVGNAVTSFENVSPCVIPWFKFDPSNGSFVAQGAAVGPVLSAFSNISS